VRARLDVRVEERVEVVQHRYPVLDVALQGCERVRVNKGRDGTSGEPRRRLFGVKREEKTSQTALERSRGKEGWGGGGGGRYYAHLSEGPREGREHRAQL
jgi:hypothetical protein